MRDNKLRNATVIYTCDPSGSMGKVHKVVETSICNYKIEFHTKLLCPSWVLEAPVKKITCYHQKIENSLF